MPFITINGQKVELSVAELIQYEALSSPVLPPITPPPALPPTAAQVVPIPVPEPQSEPEPAPEPKKEYVSPSEINRVKLEAHGYTNVGVTVSAVKTIVEQTSLLGYLSDKQQFEWLMSHSERAVHEINSLVAMCRKDWADKKQDKRKAWLPGIVAAIWIIRLEGDEEQYDLMKTRVRINRDFIEHVYAMCHKVYVEWDLQDMKRARLNPKAKADLFQDLYLLFTEKDIQMGTTK